MTQGGMLGKEIRSSEKVLIDIKKNKKQRKREKEVEAERERKRGKQKERERRALTEVNEQTQNRRWPFLRLYIMVIHTSSQGKVKTRKTRSYKYH